VFAYASPIRLDELHKLQYPQFFGLSNHGHGIDFQR
jgi:hypothetical protein